MSAFANGTFRTENVVSFDSMQQARWEQGWAETEFGDWGFGERHAGLYPFPRDAEQG